MVKKLVFAAIPVLLFNTQAHADWCQNVFTGTWQVIITDIQNQKTGRCNLSNKDGTEPMLTGYFNGSCVWSNPDESRSASAVVNSTQLSRDKHACNIVMTITEEAVGGASSTYLQLFMNRSAVTQFNGTVSPDMSHIDANMQGSVVGIKTSK